MCKGVIKNTHFLTPPLLGLCLFDDELSPCRDIITVSR